MSAASLVVKITGDLTGFNKSVKDMTKGIREAAVEVATISAALAPIALVAGELANLGMESEEVGRRFHATFGGGAAEMHEAIEQLRQSVPETTTELERLASQVNEFAKGVDIAAPQAAVMTRGLLDMAATISAAKTIPMADVLQGLEKGLMGSTKAFREFGIDIQKTAIEHEAFRLHLIKSKDELDAARTAVATYSLLLGPVAGLTDSATKATGDAAQQLRLMKADVTSLAEEMGTFLLPVIHSLISEVRSFVDALAHPSFKTALAFIASSFLAMTGNIAGAKQVWDDFRKHLEDVKAPPLTPPGVAGLIGGLPGATSNLEPVAKLKKDSQEVIAAFNQMKAAGGDMRDVTTHLVDMNAKVLALYNAQSDKLGEMALEAQKVAREYALILSLRNVVGANAGLESRSGVGAFVGPQQKEFVQAAVSSASQTQTSALELRYLAAAAQVAGETQLRLREATIRLVNTFDAGRVAALDFAEKVRASSNNFSATLASLKVQWSNIGASLGAGASDALAAFLATLGPVALAFRAVGYVLQGLQPVIDALGQPLVALGQILGEILIPVLRPLFESLKLVGIVAGVLGEILYRVAQGLANVIGGVIQAIGHLIAKIPGLGGLGHRVENFGQGVLDLANSFGKTAKDLEIEVKELEKMKFGDTAAGILGLGQAAAYAANQLTNVPSGYRVALAVFNAMAARSATTSPTMPFPGGGAAGSGGSQSYTFAPGAIVISGANKSGEQLLTDVVNAARRRSLVLFGTTTRAAEALV